MMSLKDNSCIIALFLWQFKAAGLGRNLFAQNSAWMEIGA